MAQGGTLARGPHADSSLPLLAEGRLRRGRPNLSRLRRPDEPDPRQQAGRLPDAVLRLDQLRQPPLLRRDLQQDQSRRELPLDRLVGVHGPHARRPEPARETWSSIADGKERFRKYIPFPSFVNTIENYPYPYVIGGMCWEFPCIVPSDWEAQNLHKPNSPKTLEDLKAALDCVVIKQGVFNLVFHPHGWIKNEQVVELIDYAVKKHGRKVKFLTFKEALERLNKNARGGRPLRGPTARPISPRRGVAELHSVHAARSPARHPAPRREGPRRRVPDRRHRRGRPRSTSSSRTTRNMGFTSSIPTRKGWTRKVMAGKAGEPGALPKIVRDGTNNGFFVHSRSLWWQNEDTAKLPNLVDRRSFNDLLKDVEPRGKSPEASLRSIRVEPGFTVELVATEPLVNDPIAFDWGADGRLWVVEMGDYPLGADGKGKPGGVVRILEDTEWRRPLRQGDDVPRRPRLPLRHACPGETACWSPAPRDLLRRGPRRRRQGRPSRGALHRLHRGEPAAPGQRVRAGPRRLGLRRQRRQRRDCPLDQDRQDGTRSAAATSASAPTPASSRPRAARRSTAGTATTGATGSATTIRTGPGTTSSPSRISGATRITRPLTRGRSSSPRRGSIRSAGRWPRFNDLGMANQRDLGQQPDPLPRRTVRPLVRHQPLRQRAGP